MKRGGALRFLVFASAIGCSRHPASCAPTSEAPAPRAAASAEVAEILSRELPMADADDAAEPEAFIDLVRRDAWSEAAAAIDALPAEKKAKPTTRLVRGRVAMALGDHATAAQSFEGLERELGPLADDISKWRAEAQAHAGPYLEAAQYFAKQSGAKALAKAAQAFDKAKLPSEAKSAADRAIAAGKGDAAEAPVRALRARLAEADGQTALAVEDLRFIALRAPASDEAKTAVPALAKLDPSHPLTGKERLARAEKLAEAGRTDDALSELDRAEKTASPPDADDVAWARAFALYKARDRYDKAAALFAKLGAKPGRRQAEALYYAARAHSRADRDDEAAARYRALAQSFPKSPWADEASYLAARLAFLHAAWADASAGYTAYLRKYPAGKQQASATYERALALLAGGKAAQAHAELNTLAAAASTPSEASRLRELQGVAALRAGDKEGAFTLWSEVIRSQPLGWPAIAARARLARQGGEIPPPIAPADGKASEPLGARLPPVALLYHRLGLDGEAESYLRAHEREAVLEIKGREKEALCSLYAELGRAARLYRIGVDTVSASLLARAPSPATEWGWRCVYPRPYLERVRDIEAREKLPKSLVYAVMRQESAYDPDALSSARAVGLLQVMPDTARRVAAEAGVTYDEKFLRVPSVNLDIGGRYLAKMVRSFDGSVPLAAAAYNAGPRAVRRWSERMKGLEIDLFVAAIPFEETRTYVTKVMSNLARYAYLEGGDDQVPVILLDLPGSAPRDETAEY